MSSTIMHQALLAMPAAACLAIAGFLVLAVTSLFRSFVSALGLPFDAAVTTDTPCFAIPSGGV